jgi:hypothetical protein
MIGLRKKVKYQKLRPEEGLALDSLLIMMELLF